MLAVVKTILRELDRLPVPLTVRFHHSDDNYDFPRAERIDSALLWDTLRQQHPYFHLPEDRESWVAMCESGSDQDGVDATLVARSEAVVDRLRTHGIKRLVSIGSGNAALEYHIKKRYPDLELVCSDHAPATVAILKKVFLECDEVIQFDLLSDDWSAVAAEGQAVMINRVDPLFTDQQWRAAFCSAHRAGVPTMLFVPAWFLTLRNLCRLKRQWITWKLKRVPTIFTGWIRTSRVFARYWDGLYRAESFPIDTSTAYFLQRESVEPISGNSHREHHG